MRILLMILCVFLPLGCNAQNAETDGMKSAEQAAHERARKELVAYMSLETMFPDSEVRALAEAASKGQLQKVEALVEQGVDVNARGVRNATPLFFAMRSSNLEGFTKLLELGADPNVVFDDGGTVMHWAVQHKNDAFLKAALKHGGNPNLKNDDMFKHTPLFEALGEQSDKLDILLSAGADVNAQNRFGSTPVMVAAGRGRFDIVYKLLDHGADYQIKNNSGHTLADRIADKRGLMDSSHELYQWMQKVIVWLEERGVHVPAKKDD